MARRTATGPPAAPTVRPLDVDTWPAFARLVEANNGVWGGCWCLGFQYGSPAELPEIKSRRRYDKDLVDLPDWRITCLFTGTGLRRRGVAHLALGGALAEIARHGGGRVEGYPEETDDRSVAGSFLHTGPMAAFEAHGFNRTRPISPHRWVVSRVVEPA